MCSLLVIGLDLKRTHYNNALNASCKAIAVKITAITVSKIRQRSGELKKTFNFGAKAVKALNQNSEAKQAPIVKAIGEGSALARLPIKTTVSK